MLVLFFNRTLTRQASHQNKKNNTYLFVQYFPHAVSAEIKKAPGKPGAFYTFKCN